MLSKEICALTKIKNPLRDLMLTTQHEPTTCLFLGVYCLSEVSGEAVGLKVGDVKPLMNPVFGNGVTYWTEIQQMVSG